MKGQTNQPLVVVIENDWNDHPAVRAERIRGHVILTLDQWVSKYAMTGSPTPHLVLLRTAHGWDEVLFTEAKRKDGTSYKPFWDAAIKAGRQRKREGTR